MLTIIKTLKQYVHWLNVILLFFLGMTLAHSVDSYIALRIVSLKGDVAGERGFSRKPIRSFYHKISYGNILSLLSVKKLFSLSAPNEEKEETITTGAEDLVLKGVIAGWRPIARAMILKKGNKEPEVFKYGDDVYGYKLISIRRDSVVLKSSDGRKVVLYLFSSKRKGKKKGSFGGSGGNVKKLVLSRAEIQRIIKGNMENVLTSMNASLYRRRGEVLGFLVNAVKPGGIAYRIGFRRGDIIKSVNGYKLDSVEKAMELWKALRDEDHIRIDIERHGKPLTLDIEITR